LIAANGPIGVTATKRIATAAEGWSLDEGWDLQQEVVDRVLASEDALEGAKAFTERRDPVWQGR
jgi:enoyl-CoA hydratase